MPTSLLDPQVAKIRPAIELVPGSDGVQLSCRVWHGNVGSPVVIYLHGIEGHSQWIENTAAILNTRGINFYAPDRRGSGLNQRERGHLNDYKVYVSDIEAMIRRLAQHYAGHAIVLMANCWSAKAAVLLASNNYKSTTDGQPVAISGLVLTSPAIYTKVDFDLKSKIKLFYDWIQGSYRLSEYWPVPLTPPMFTNNPPYLEYVERDPLRLKEATTSFFMQTFFMGLKAQKAAKALDLPLLLLQSGADQIVDVAKLENWYNQIPAARKTMHLFPDASHSLDFDQVWFKEYTHLLSEWLSSITPL